MTFDSHPSVPMFFFTVSFSMLSRVLMMQHFLKECSTIFSGIFLQSTNKFSAIILLFLLQLFKHISKGSRTNILDVLLRCFWASLMEFSHSAVMFFQGKQCLFVGGGDFLFLDIFALHLSMEPNLTIGNFA